MKKWIISDTHFNHTKLLEYENRPENFNNVIIDNWNKVVAEDDIVIHLGDVILGRDSELGSIMAKLKGKKILCRGNHDHHSDDWYMKNGFDFVTDYFILDNIAYSHAPLTPLPLQCVRQHATDKTYLPQPVSLNIHGHFHRGIHRGKIGMPDRFYEHTYFDANRDSYFLIQIEDTLAPYSLESIIQKHKERESMQK